MKTLEKLNRRVIELIHGKPYGKVLSKVIGEQHQYISPEEVEGNMNLYFGEITLSRVLQALKNKKHGEDIVARRPDVNSDNPFDEIEVSRRKATKEDIEERSELFYEDFRSNAGYRFEPWCEELEVLSIWKLTNPDGSTCTTADQTEETQTKLLNLLK